MHKNQQVSFEKILQKISSCMKTAHQELGSDRKTECRMTGYMKHFRRSKHSFVYWRYT